MGMKFLRCVAKDFAVAETKDFVLRQRVVSYIVPKSGGSVYKNSWKLRGRK